MAKMPSNTVAHLAGSLNSSTHGLLSPTNSRPSQTPTVQQNPRMGEEDWDPNYAPSPEDKPLITPSDFPAAAHSAALPAEDDNNFDIFYRGFTFDTADPVEENVPDTGVPRPVFGHDFPLFETPGPSNTPGPEKQNGQLENLAMLDIAQSQHAGAATGLGIASAPPQTGPLNDTATPDHLQSLAFDGTEGLDLAGPFPQIGASNDSVTPDLSQYQPVIGENGSGIAVPGVLIGHIQDPMTLDFLDDAPVEVVDGMLADQWNADFGTLFGEPTEQHMGSYAGLGATNGYDTAALGPINGPINPQMAPVPHQYQHPAPSNAFVPVAPLPGPRQPHPSDPAYWPQPQRRHTTGGFVPGAPLHGPAQQPAFLPASAAQYPQPGATFNFVFGPPAPAFPLQQPSYPAYGLQYPQPNIAHGPVPFAPFAPSAMPHQHQGFLPPAARPDMAAYDRWYAELTQSLPPPEKHKKSVQPMTEEVMEWNYRKDEQRRIDALAAQGARRKPVPIERAAKRPRNVRGG